MIRNSKYFGKNYILVFIGVIFVFLFVFFMPVIYNLDNNNDVRLIGNDNKISISNVLPLADVSGKNLNVDTINDKILNSLDFSIEGTGSTKKSVDYEVYLIGNSENTINTSYVKVYLTDNEDNPFNLYASNVVPTYRDLRVSNTKADAKIIYAGSIKGGERKDFKLRVWLADNYFINDSEQQFSGIIVVRRIS